ncbi:MAG: hypothetical protein SCALA702_21350 [Melioribacteraceae bacterium]|nr:MAG: hypothetical protein SCALA702_21350 [Melioribacteraceae bacterium]
MKHFIVELVYRAPIEKVNEIVGAHREFLQKGYDEGIFLASGPQVPKIGGVIIARSESMEKLALYLQNDPYQLNNIAHYQYIEFNPVKSQSFISDWIEGK